jgi:hypothetical protein
VVIVRFTTDSKKGGIKNEKTIFNIIVSYVNEHVYH